MTRAPRKGKISFKQRVKRSLTRAMARLQQTKAARKTPPKVVATKPTRPPRIKATATARRIAPAKPKLAPSQRAPRKPPRVTTARPAVGAPPVGVMMPSVAPPLTTTITSPAAATPHQPVAPPASPALPRRYGETLFVLAVRDPWWLYAYWEVIPARAAQVQRLMSPEERAHHETVLRCYDVTDRDGDSTQAHRSLDIVLTHDADNWFVDTGEAHRTWVAELGYRTARGRFYALVRSNVVATPRAGPSEQFDEAWMTTDEEYWKLLGVVYGLGFGTSSFEIRQLLERRFREVISSARGSVNVHTPAVTR